MSSGLEPLQLAHAHSFEMNSSVETDLIPFLFRRQIHPFDPSLLKCFGKLLSSS